LTRRNAGSPESTGKALLRSSTEAWKDGWNTFLCSPPSPFAFRDSYRFPKCFASGEIDFTIYSRNSSFASFVSSQPEEDWLIARHSQICADQANVGEVDHLQSGILRFRRRTRLMPATRRISLDRHVGVERYRKRILFGEISCR